MGRIISVKNENYNKANDALFQTTPPPLGRIKIQILDEEEDCVRYAHIAYVQNHLLKEFRAKYDIQTVGIKPWLIRWCREDFNLDTKLSTIAEIQIMRRVVDEYYKHIYPTIYKETRVTTGSWLRIWITEHLRRDLKYERFGF